MDNSRHYINQFPDYGTPTADKYVNPAMNEIQDEFREQVQSATKTLLLKLEDKKKHWTYHDDCSVYTGTAGIGYMFYHYGKTFNDPAYIEKAVELLRTCVNKFRGKREVTFLTGHAGPLALNAVVSHSQGNKEECQKMIAKLKTFSAYVLDESSDVPDELLYGRAGYLHSLLFVNANISPPPIEDELFRQVIALIIKSGTAYSASRGFKSPIMYAWHDSEYLGGAHGLAGILYLLLQARQYLTEVQLEQVVKPALHFLQQLQYPSGNFPSSIGSHSDRLVHWCHGAPGMTMLFTLAYEVYKEKKFLDLAIQCGEVIWARGLLRKGYSICHGVSGNAYSFLNLFQHTKDAKHLYRACKFAEWSMDHGTHQNRNPDRPFSLFEGLAGVIYFLLDMQNPTSAKFPAYTV